MLTFYSGDGGIRTLVPRKANAFRVRPVMTTSIHLHTFFIILIPKLQVNLLNLLILPME